MTPAKLAAISATVVLSAATLMLSARCSTAAEVASTSPAPAVFYVATDGSDEWSGKLPKPNAAKTDGPFATPQRARDQIRKLKKQGGLPSGGAQVQFRGGEYCWREPLELAAEDSATEAAPVVYRAAEGEEVRLSGGLIVTGFKPVGDPEVLKRLEAAARGKVLQADLRRLGVSEYGKPSGGGLELFFEDRPMTLARWPNEGFVRIVDLAGGDPVDVRGTKGDRTGRFMYEGDRPTRWLQENDAWVHGYWFWDWSDQRHKVKAIDTKRRMIEVVPPYHHYGYRKGQWFYGLNILAELDSPGEWYLDRQTGILYFWPPGPVEKGRPTVSILATMVKLQDASHLTIRGMTFEAARGTAITISGGTHNLVAGCTLRNLGSQAVTISGGSSNGVAACDIYNTGSGCISLSGGQRKTLVPAGHYARNNHIHDFGRWKRMYTPAVSLSGVGNRAVHNLMHSAPHQAISFGGNDHLIELNEIHHVCTESNDAGAIYSGRDWTMRGTVIRHNFMHHITGFKNRGCVGVYLDDMFCGTQICGNVFYKVTRAAFIGGGRDVNIENNLFVDCNPALHVDARAMGWAAPCEKTTMRQRLAAMPYKTPLWQRRYPKLLGILEDEPAAPKGNLITRNACQGGKWDEVTSTARPYVTLKGNLVAEDLGLLDVAGMNFQLRDDSPVYGKLPGFKKIPFERIGLVKDEYRTSLPQR